MKHTLFSSRCGLTLIEILISISILASIMLVAFDAIGGTLSFRKQATDELDLSAQSYLAMEIIARAIKDGGSIDYEEYWNRSQVGTLVSSGVYAQPTGYGNYGYTSVASDFTSTNFGSGKYLCAYQSGSTIGSCNSKANSFSGGTASDTDTSGKPQRYGQYKAQFYTYKGDRDGDGLIVGDSDDEDPGKGPHALSASGDTKELYLVKRSNQGQQVERLILRNRILSSGDGQLEMLKLIGSDEGYTHDKSGSGNADGEIDTWRCHGDFVCTGATVGGSRLPLGTGSEFVRVLPENMSILNWDLQVLPTKDANRSWREQSYSQAENIRLTLTIGWSTSQKALLRNGAEKTVTLSTLINLDNVGRQ